MNTQLIAALVGGILLFLWQFLSWGPLSLHAKEMQYTDKQDAVLQFLGQNLQEGSYMLPMYPPGSTSEQQQTIMQGFAGKPWALIQYHNTMDTNMGMMMFRSFIVNVLSAFLLAWLLMKIPGINFTTALLSSLAVGLIGYLSVTYLNSIWFEQNTISHLIDSLVSWGLVGCWLGWYLPGK